MPPTDPHAEALDLQAIVRRLEADLESALAAPHPAAGIAPLNAAQQAIGELRQAVLHHGLLDIALVDRVESGISRQAAALYQAGAGDALDAADREAFLDLHAHSLTHIDGVGTATARRLFAHGIGDPRTLLDQPDEALDAIPDIGAATLTRLKEGCARARKLR